MALNKGNRLLATGIVGSIIAAICCFTPLLVLLLSALGFAAMTGYLDYVLLPVLVIFVGLIVYGWRLSAKCATQGKSVGAKKRWHYSAHEKGG